MAESKALAKRRDSLLSLIEKNGPKITEALSKHLDGDRFLRIARTALLETPALWECHPSSVLSSIAEASSIGLEPNGALGEAALVPFNNKYTKRKECQLMVMYRGYIELADRTGKVEFVEAEVVHEKDVFEFRQGTSPSLEHIQKLGGDKGPVIAVYAIVHYLTGKAKFVVLDCDEVEKIRSSSKAKDGSAWRKWWSEMAKKTALRRLFKYTRLSPELNKATILDDSTDGGVRPGQQRDPNTFDAADDQTEALKDRLKKAQADTQVEDGMGDVDAESVEVLPEADADGVVIEPSQKLEPAEMNSAGEPSKFAGAYYDLKTAFGDADIDFSAAINQAMKDHELEDIDAATQAQKKKIIALLSAVLKAG